MTKFFFKFKKTYFWSISKSWEKNIFQKNQAAMPSFIRVSGTMQNSEKSNDQIPRKHPTDVRREGWTNPTSRVPSCYCQGSNEYNCCRLRIKSHRYTVWCWSNQKLLHQSQLAKYQLNS